jgi:predicted component of type VI protein secretion system
MVACLLVLTPSKWQGKVVTLARSPFVIGRGARCHLRATSSRLGNRHCAIILRGAKAYLRDLHEAEDTFVDDRPVRGIVQICDGQRLRLGPLVFAVCLNQEAHEEVQPTLVKSEALIEEEAAAVLLAAEEADREWFTEESAAHVKNPGGAGSVLCMGPSDAANRILQKHPDLELPIARLKSEG